mmetsp:Transcript_36014/g.113104  ORF Transcript_36014/g.113104 Transcript_36014/m.113104 type:complete len:222 (-) Transcript_36014:11-676(-)
MRELAELPDPLRILGLHRRQLAGEQRAEPAQQQRGGRPASLSADSIERGGVDPVSSLQPPEELQRVGGGRGVVLALDRPLGVGRIARDARARLRRHSSQLRQLCVAARRLCLRHRRRLGERSRPSRQAATEVPAGAGVPLGALAHAARRIRLVRALAKRKRLPHVRTSAGRAADGARQRFAGEPRAGGVHRVPARRGEEILAREEGEAAVRAAHHSTSRAA